MGSSPNTILTYNLVRLGVYMVKICHEKMLTLEMYPSKINCTSSRKKITSHPLENHPDKKLRSPEIILIP